MTDLNIINQFKPIYLICLLHKAILSSLAYLQSMDQLNPFFQKPSQTRSNIVDKRVDRRPKLKIKILEKQMKNKAKNIINRVLQE